MLDVRVVDVPAGVTQEEGHTGFLIHLPSAVRALTFLARRISVLICTVTFRLICGRAGQGHTGGRPDRILKIFSTFLLRCLS